MATRLTACRASFRARPTRPATRWRWSPKAARRRDAAVEQPDLGLLEISLRSRVSRYKWLEPRHMVNVCDRWARDKTDNLQYAFFNGVGLRKLGEHLGHLEPDHPARRRGPAARCQDRARLCRLLISPDGSRTRLRFARCVCQQVPGPRTNPLDDGQPQRIRRRTGSRLASVRAGCTLLRRVARRGIEARGRRRSTATLSFGSEPMASALCWRRRPRSDPRRDQNCSRNARVGRSAAERILPRMEGAAAADWWRSRHATRPANDPTGW